MKNLEIERLRALAILTVINAHLHGGWPLPIPPFAPGVAGVELFFVISGYVICNSLFRLLPDLSNVSSLSERFARAAAALKIFYIKRFFRIVPLALLWVAIPIAFSYFVPGHGNYSPPNQLLREAIDIFTLRHNYTVAYGAPGNIGVYWSLMVEEHFYLLFPLFLILVSRNKSRILSVLFLIFVIVCIVRPFFPIPNDLPMNLRIFQNRYLSHRIFDGLLAGVLIALVRGRPGPEANSKKAKISGRVLGVLFLLGFCFIPSLDPTEPVDSLGITMEVVLSSALVLLATWQCGSILEFPYMKQVLEWIGARSYGLYLVHGFGLRVAGMSLTYFADHVPNFVARPGGPAVIFVGSFSVVTLLLADLCYKLVEKPLIRYGNTVTQVAPRAFQSS